MKKHLIIDGNNLVHRAYWISNNNDAADHVFITLRALKSYVEQFKPDEIWCAWDMRLSKEPALRKKLDESYKQTRDTEYNQQVHTETDLIVECFGKLGVKNIFPTKGEADDIIFWLTKEKEGKKTIVSADTDFYQLISDDTSVYSPTKKILYDRQAFSEAFGFAPENYPLYKSITGDKADNIIGLDKMGPKRALQVIKGETLLTEDQNKQVSENMKLIDLNNVGSSEWDSEYDTYKRQSFNTLPIEFDGFLKICEERGFRTIINQQTIWHKAFCIKSVMANIISELFSG